MRIKYPKAIGESEEDLTSLEHRFRGQKAADRVRMLRLLKSGAVISLKECAPLVGYSVTQLTRWWECYRAQGLTGLLKQHKPVGKASRMTPEAWAGEIGAMRKGHIATLQEAREYLEREWGLRYKNGKSLWWLAEETSGQVEDRAQTP
jgi:transposase